MTGETKKEKRPKIKEPSFECKFCNKTRPLDEIMILTRFFPPVNACRDCGKKMQ